MCGKSLIKETKYLYNENVKTLKKEIKEAIRRWFVLACAFSQQPQLI